MSGLTHSKTELGRKVLGRGAASRSSASVTTGTVMEDQREDGTVRVALDGQALTLDGEPGIVMRSTESGLKSGYMVEVTKSRASGDVGAEPIVTGCLSAQVAKDEADDRLGDAIEEVAGDALGRIQEAVQKAEDELEAYKADAATTYVTTAEAIDTGSEFARRFLTEYSNPDLDGHLVGYTELSAARDNITAEVSDTFEKAGITKKGSEVEITTGAITSYVGTVVENTEEGIRQEVSTTVTQTKNGLETRISAVEDKADGAASAASGAQATADGAASTASAAKRSADSVTTLIRQTTSGITVGKSSDGGASYSGCYALVSSSGAFGVYNSSGVSQSTLYSYGVYMQNGYVTSSANGITMAVGWQGNPSPLASFQLRYTPSGSDLYLDGIQLVNYLWPVGSVFFGTEAPPWGSWLEGRVRLRNEGNSSALTYSDSTDANGNALAIFYPVGNSQSYMDWSLVFRYGSSNYTGIKAWYRYG